MIGQPGVQGIKTGITNSAGPCLSTAIQTDKNQMIIVLLNCKNMDSRWSETQKLADWANKRLVRINQFKQEIKQNDKLIKMQPNLVDNCNSKLL
jgi:D-alanyl-D-alanine carboxypeptidase